jgi:hypothetical protein
MTFSPCGRYISIYIIAWFLLKTFGRNDTTFAFMIHNTQQQQQQQYRRFSSRFGFQMINFYLSRRLKANYDDNNNDNNEKIKSLDVERIRQEAEALRQEIVDLRRTIEQKAVANEAKRIDNVDRWLDQLLVNQTIGTIQQLNTVPQVVDILINNRYSPDQVFQIFERLCETTSINGRDSLVSNGLLQVLVEAVGKVDEIEREDNSNKRWSGIVERTLHKRLFAMEWGINYIDQSNRKRYDD